MAYPPPPMGEDDEEEKPGDKFEGTMEHGVRQGKGTYTWSNGAVFTGEYVDNKKHGKGKLAFPDKGVYDGGYTQPSTAACMRRNAAYESWPTRMHHVSMTNDPVTHHEAPQRQAAQPSGFPCSTCTLCGQPMQAPSPGKRSSKRADPSAIRRGTCCCS